MFLELDGVLVNLAHVAQVQPYTPGEKKRLTIILSNGNAVHVPDGDRAVEAIHAFKLHCGQIPRSDTPVPRLRGVPIQYLDNLPVTFSASGGSATTTIIFPPQDEPPTAGVTANLPKAPKPPKKGKK